MSSWPPTLFSICTYLTGRVGRGGSASECNGRLVLAERFEACLPFSLSTLGADATRHDQHLEGVSSTETRLGSPGTAWLGTCSPQPQQTRL